MGCRLFYFYMRRADDTVFENKSSAGPLLSIIAGELELGTLGFRCLLDAPRRRWLVLTWNLTTLQSLRKEKQRYRNFEPALPALTYLMQNLGVVVLEW